MAVSKLVDSGQPFVNEPDIQRTTFAVDAPGRFFCNTWDEAVSAQQGRPFDVVIVGSGMYGGYLAAKLYEFGGDLPEADRPRVLVLESGPFLLAEHIQNLTGMGDAFDLPARDLIDEATQGRGDKIDPGRLFVRHHRCVGGKSPFWGGWAPRLTEEDLAQWPAEVREYLLQAGRPDGYEYVEREIGARPTADFMSGKLLDALLARVRESLPGDPRLAFVDDAPIAVLGQSPGSGLFSMDKFSSLALLLSAVRDDIGRAKNKGGDAARRLFLVPNAEVLRLETQSGAVRQVVAALRDFAEPENRSRARVVRLDVQPGAVVVLAGNTVNSTRLALNSFPRPRQMSPTGELMGRNLMAHVRSNFIWKVDRKKLIGDTVLGTNLQTAALHVQGAANTAKGRGRFHFQFYAAPNMDTNAFPGASNNPEEFLYRMVPSVEEYERMLKAQEGLGTRIVVGIRTCGETFGDKTTPVDTSNAVSWMNVSPFGGAGDDVYVEGGREVRVPKAFANLVETAADRQVRDAQDGAAFALIERLTGLPTGAAGSRDPAAPVELIAENKDRIGTTFHDSGTLWLGADPAASVTDVNGRFHHVANAACVDQAIFPTVGSANPVPTGLALARKAARAIIDRHRPPPPPAGGEAGFEPLYKGDFAADGWKYAGPRFDGQVPFFDVQVGGPVLGAGVGSPFFDSVLGVLWFSKRTFRDFVLRLEWRTFDGAANAGVLLRAPEPAQLDADHFYNSAVEVQIDERGFAFDATNPGNSFYGSPLHRTGAVYGLFPARSWAAKRVNSRVPGRDAYWNLFEITLRGPNVEVRLNGQIVSGGTLQNPLPAGAANAPNTDPARKRSDGFLGLQCHTEVVQFRNIRVKTL